VKKQARIESESKSRKLQLHRETVLKLASSGGDGGGGTVTLYTCPDNTSGTCNQAAICAG
jgi:hypothetical protein